ncbi:hypothetical protein J6590_096585 [Homalodisca vitripennis]|nr:hypothetical protein J6590_096585 [Homalodisca vitripennis]
MRERGTTASKEGERWRQGASSQTRAPHGPPEWGDHTPRRKRVGQIRAVQLA